jgi:hypothetical protein
MWRVGRRIPWSICDRRLIITGHVDGASIGNARVDGEIAWRFARLARVRHRRWVVSGIAANKRHGQHGRYAKQTT